jgi:hypothetical protein
MARAKEHSNGKLEEAMTALIQAQAVMVQTQATFVAQKADTDKRAVEIAGEMAQLKNEMAKLEKESDARFARIEAILIEHNRILQSLANTVGERIGFKAPEN